MKTIVLKMVVSDDEEHSTNKVVEDMLQSYGGCLYEWDSRESTKKETKYYLQEQKHE